MFDIEKIKNEYNNLYNNNNLNLLPINKVIELEMCKEEITKNLLKKI